MWVDVQWNNESFYILEHRQTLFHGQFINLLYELIKYGTVKTKSRFKIQMFSEKWKGFQIKGSKCVKDQMSLK